jgi:uncharacterized protein YjbI with pentapeptide repeats
MEKNNVVLKERWLLPEWRKVLASVLDSWAQGISLTQIPDLPKYLGRIDLRGIEIKLGSGRFLRLNGIDISDVDFSFAKFNGIKFINCNLNNLLFYKSEGGPGIQDRNSTFTNIEFIHTDWRGAALGLDGAQYINVNFIKCDLRHVIGYRGFFRGCNFLNCRLEYVDFQVSHFSRCRFKGKLEHVWFRGYYPLSSDEERFGKTEPNSMVDIDFSEAVLRDVMFTNNCDLSKVIPPKDGRHFFYPNWENSIKNAKAKVEKTWIGPFKEEALRILEIYSIHKNPMNIINLDYEEELIRKHYSDSSSVTEFTIQFINLLKEVA